MNAETKGTDKIKDMSVSVKDLERAQKAAAKATRNIRAELKESAITAGAFKNAFDGLDNSLRMMQGVLSDLTDAYTVQIQAETQLATVMRQRMQATDADINAIKKLASEQQELGVVGDEVQLAGAQQIATFLTQRRSIETLLPAMNDLLVQQKGLKATGNDAVAVANLMGKAMQGQTSALKRVGITFSEAQAKVMQYGTESERSAMLAQIITDNVGHMNAEVAKTDVGKLKQQANALGDVKEGWGAVAMSVQPYVAFASQLTTMTTGVIRLVDGTNLLIKRLIPASVAFKANEIAANAASAAATKYGWSARAAAIATHSLKVAIKGLLITTVVGAAVVALTTALEYFMNSADDAADSTDKLTDAEKRAAAGIDEAEMARQQEKRTIEDSRAALALNIAKLKEFKGSKEAERRLAEEMNNIYGDTMGRYSSVSDWYKTLTRNSEAYCRQLTLEARARTIANEIAEIEHKQYDMYPDGRPQPPAENIPEQKPASDRRDLKNASVPPHELLDPTKLGRLSDPRRLIQEATEGTDFEQPFAVVAKPEFEMPEKGEIRSAIYEGLEKKRGTLQEELQSVFAEMAEIKFDGGGKGGGKGGDGGNKSLKYKENAKSLNDWLNNERYLVEALHAVDETDQDRIKTLSEKLAVAREHIKVSREALGIDEKKKEHVPLMLEEIKTWEQLNEEIAYNNELFQKAGAEQKSDLIKRREELDKLVRKFEEFDAALATPPDMASLKNNRDIDKAMSYWRSRQDTYSSSDDIEKAQRAIEQLQRMKDARSFGAELPEMLREASKINELSKKEYKIRVRGMGFDEVTRKINDLRERLADMENPVTETQRAEIESLIATYEKWRRDSIDTFAAIRQGWDGIQSIAGGIESIDNAMEESENTWKKVQGVINGLLQIFDGVTSVISTINQLREGIGGLSQDSAKSEKEKAAAQLVSTGAQLANMALAPVAAEAQLPVIAANKEAAASYLEVAAAAFYAAHASIPFAGFALGSVFAGGAASVVASIGQSVPKFAAGGIAYGPTLGLFGEYAGASNNPEVVAPLDKLRGMLNPAPAVGGEVTVRIKGRDLAGVLNLNNLYRNRI